MIINDESCIVNKLESSLIDDAIVVIYDRDMFIVQATGVTSALALNRAVNDASRVIF
jgi:hypothetical protein